MKYLWLYAVLLIVSCSSACRSRPAPAQAGSFPTRLNTNAFTAVSPLNPIQQEWLKPPADFFRLGPGDVLEVEIIGAKELPSTAMVGPDGKVYYSLLPGLFVWGLSL